MRINGCGFFMIPLLLLLTVFLGYSIRSAPWCREHGSKDESYYTLILIIRTAILADTRVPQKRHFRPASAHFIMKRQPPGITMKLTKKEFSLWICNPISCLSLCFHEWNHGLWCWWWLSESRHSSELGALIKCSSGWPFVVLAGTSITKLPEISNSVHFCQ